MAADDDTPPGTAPAATAAGSPVPAAPRAGGLRMSGALHIPGLVDELPLAVGAAAGRPPRPRLPWPVRLREALGSWMPLLLMLALALASWWLVRNSGSPDAGRASPGVRHTPDYTLDHFHLQRFDAAGVLVLVIDGEHLIHTPDDDMMEIDTLRVVSTSPDGREMTATARRGRARADGSEVWLDGEAQVLSVQAGQSPVQMNGEHLHAFTRKRQVDSVSPVIVRQDRSEFRADGLTYDHDTRLLTLLGRSQAILQPAPRPGRP